MKENALADQPRSMDENGIWESINKLEENVAKLDEYLSVLYVTIKDILRPEEPVPGDSDSSEDAYDPRSTVAIRIDSINKRLDRIMFSAATVEHRVNF